MSGNAAVLARAMAMHVVLPIVVGAGATALLDVWNVMLKRVFGVASLDYCLLGRWVTHMPTGVFRHKHIGQSSAGAFECVLGWLMHYGIGAALALAFVFIAGSSWLVRPTLAPAVVFGIATVILPFFVLQPALGFGVASAKARSPLQARVKSLTTHAVYGLGLYWMDRLAIAIHR